MNEEEEQFQSLIKVSAIAGGVVIFLLVGIFVWHAWTVKRDGKTILHSGVTYTGPTPAGNAPSANGKFTTDANTPWKTVNGVKYAYAFDAPETLTLVRIGDNDPYDIWAIAWNNLLPQSNVLIGVDNLQNNANLKQYVTEPKISYVENWWKQFGALTGVSAITPFTNKEGFKGYKAKYTTGSGPAPTDDVFFEIPKRKELVIHLSNGILDPDVFNKIVDSVRWDEGITASASAKK